MAILFLIQHNQINYDERKERNNTPKQVYTRVNLIFLNDLFEKLFA